MLASDAQLSKQTVNFPKQKKRRKLWKKNSLTARTAFALGRLMTLKRRECSDSSRTKRADTKVSGENAPDAVVCYTYTHTLSVYCQEGSGDFVPRGSICASIESCCDESRKKNRRCWHVSVHSCEARESYVCWRLLDLGLFICVLRPVWYFVLSLGGCKAYCLLSSLTFLFSFFFRWL